jgi:hypothetical protein
LTAPDLLESTDSDDGDDGEMWGGMESEVDLSDQSATPSDDGEQRGNQECTTENLPLPSIDHNDASAFIPDEPEITLTSAENAVATHAPSVRASMVPRNTRQHGSVDFCRG